MNMADKMLDKPHDDKFQEGLKMLEDAVLLFAGLNSQHGQAIYRALHGALTLSGMAYQLFKK
jgi:hypothetical protein